MTITRVTQSIIFDTSRSVLQRQARQLLDAQTQVSTQRQINTLSDDPLGAGSVLRLRTQLRQTEQFQRNIGIATSLTEAYDAALEQAVDMISRVRELVVGQSSTATANDLTREATAVEIITLREQLISIANTRIGSQHIFSGHQTDDPAFLSAEATAVPDPGNTGTAVVDDASVSSVIDLTGDAYEIVFTGPSTFDIINVDEGLTISSGNTYVPGQRIVFDGISVTLSGSPDPGDVISVTTTDTGTYSGDDGVTQLEIEQDSFMQTNLRGDVVFQGATLSSGVDIFGLLNDVVEALRDGDETTLVDSLALLDDALAQISSAQAAIGARENQLERATIRLSDLSVNLKTLISSLEDIDATEAITNFTEAETAYQTSLEATSRVMQLSLLDYLR
ncbi:flagellar hook-associated protein FlgL [Candidatus Sumerlaeota bacterium]|nr:flagellar hook-associated protein FlgL [Candidatus Sumerlaeota bacterium]